MSAVVDLADADMDMMNFSPGIPVDGLKCRMAMLMNLLHASRHVHGLFGGVDLADVHVQKFFAGVAIVPACLVVHVDHVSIQVQDKDGIRCAVEQSAINRLAGLEGSIGGFQLSGPLSDAMSKLDTELAVFFLTFLEFRLP